MQGLSLNLKKIKQQQTNVIMNKRLQHSALLLTEQVKSLTATMKGLGNPYEEKSTALYSIDTKVIMNDDVVKTVESISQVGTSQYEDFVKCRLKGSVPISEPIPKNKLALFSTPSKAANTSRKKAKIQELKHDCNLFSRLYIGAQSREGCLDEFFSHENQFYPPSLSSGGVLRSTKKSDILECISNATNMSSSYPEVTAIALDGAAIVHMVNPGSSRTFGDFCELFCRYVHGQLKKAERVDVVFDVYIPDSLKSCIREKRGGGKEGRGRLVDRDSAFPTKKWKSFLSIDENKTRLFQLLADSLSNVELTEAQSLIATQNDQVVVYGKPVDCAHMSPCTHEEADTRLVLHVAHASSSGHNKACIRTVDSDVVIIACAKFDAIKLQELWIALGTNGNMRFIPVHEVVATLGPSKTASLPFVHAFSGCDTTSSFAFKGKKTVWDIWERFPEVTQAFSECLTCCEEPAASTISLIERFTVLLYDRTSDVEEVNEARRVLFTKSAATKSLEYLPPTKAALIQHIRRAALQSHIWTNALMATPAIPDPGEWGWVREGCEWRPFWTSLPEAARVCAELVHCGCKKGCSSARCKCLKAGLKCTELCACGRNCANCAI